MNSKGLRVGSKETHRARQGSGNVTGMHLGGAVLGRYRIAKMLPDLSHDVSRRTAAKSLKVVVRCAGTVRASSFADAHPCRLGPLANGFCRWHGGLVE